MQLKNMIVESKRNIIEKNSTGAIAVSGLPDPADHIYVVEALERFLGVKAPEIPEEVDESFIN